MVGRLVGRELLHTVKPVSLAWDTTASRRYIARKRVREREGKVGARRVVEHEETGGWQRKGERENS